MIDNRTVVRRSGSDQKDREEIASLQFRGVGEGVGGG